VAQLATLLRVRGPDREKLRQARQLARAGRSAEAVAAYRAIFPDGIPDDELALEFAQALAGTPGGWEPARTQLADLARKHPDDPRYQVAIAAHLSTRKPVSAETLKALRELAGCLQSRARRRRRGGGRSAMDVTDGTVPALRDYIAANPGETAVQDRLELVQQELAAGRKAAVVADDPATRARREGWRRSTPASSRSGRRIRDAIAAAEGWRRARGLGLLRMRQGARRGARAFERAKALDASNRAKWESLAQTARYWACCSRRAGARGGKLDVAEARAREARAIDRRDRTARPSSRACS
jgi:hypothetical protein